MPGRPAAKEPDESAIAASRIQPDAPTFHEAAMGRLSLPVVIVVAVVIALALTWLAVGRGSYGSDELVAQSRTVPPFKRIAVTGSTNVVLVQDKGGPIVVETPRRGKARVTTEGRGDTLGGDATHPPRWGAAPFQKSSWAPSRGTNHLADLEAIQ